MRPYIVISMLLFFPLICCTADEKLGHFMGISSSVPKSMMIAEIPSWGLDHPQVLSDSNDPNQAIRKREIDYTRIWLRKTINPDLLIDTSKEDIQLLSDEDFQLLSGLGKKKDDALMISWNKDQFDITVVDGRFLALSVRVKNEVQADVEEVFRKVINYGNKNRVKVNLETLSAADSNDTWGRINIDRGLATGWYEKPVEWHKKGDEIIFGFEKVMKLPNGRGPITKDEIILQLNGGIPIDDHRSYLRFKNSNREELAKEYFQKRKN